MTLSPEKVRGPFAGPLSLTVSSAVDAEDLLDRHDYRAVHLGDYASIAPERAREGLVDLVDDARHQTAFVRVRIEVGMVDAVPIGIVARRTAVAAVLAIGIVFVGEAVFVVVDPVGAGRVAGGTFGPGSFLAIGIVFVGETISIVVDAVVTGLVTRRTFWFLTIGVFLVGVTVSIVVDAVVAGLVTRRTFGAPGALV
jgi:hypothetical protein